MHRTLSTKKPNPQQSLFPLPRQTRQSPCFNSHTVIAQRSFTLDFPLRFAKIILRIISSEHSSSALITASSLSAAFAVPRDLKSWQGTQLRVSEHETKTPSAVHDHSCPSTAANSEG